MRIETWRRWLGRKAAVRVAAPEGYALWAPAYPPYAHNPLMQIEESVVAPILAGLAPARALDVGTGTGRYLTVLRRTGARVVGLDLSLSMLMQGPAPAPRVCADACQLPFADGRFDLVCSSLMAGDVRDISAWIAEASRVLAPGGSLVYSDFHPAWATERWRRTFRARDGREFELPYCPHAMDEHLGGLARASFLVHTIREPRAPGRSAPVVVVFHAEKPGGAPRRPRAGVDVNTGVVGPPGLRAS